MKPEDYLVQMKSGTPSNRQLSLDSLGVFLLLCISCQQTNRHVNHINVHGKGDSNE